MKTILIIFYSGLLVIIVLVCVINILIHVASRVFIYKNAESVPEAQAVIIPGAAIWNGQLSPVLRDRTDIAIELYAAKKISKILVSGDNSTISHNEVNPVRDYLIEKGVPSEDIFLDHAGFDTYSTLYRARDIFKVTSVIISSQSFHLPRAVFIARKLGLEAYGVSADTGYVLFNNYIREVFADVRAVIDILIHRKPKFLGNVIPITGNGSDYE